MGELKPILEEVVDNPDGSTFTWHRYDEKDTGLALVTLTDDHTGVMLSEVHPNPKKRTAAHMAWAGARHSRAPGTTPQIMHEMGEKGVDPDAKLDETFTGYGHGSVGDMARLMVGFDHVPMTVPLVVFNNGVVNSGQEKSTRFQQRFGGATLQPLQHSFPAEIAIDQDLEEMYQALGRIALENFAAGKKALTTAYTDFFRPDEGNPAHASALKARVLDSVRFNLLLGQSTSFSYEDSARNWQRVIKGFAGAVDPSYRRLGAQLGTLLSPSSELEELLQFRAGAPTLLRHTEPSSVVRDNLRTLKGWLDGETDFLSEVLLIDGESGGLDEERGGFVKQGVDVIDPAYQPGEKMVAQYILAVHPERETLSILEWVGGLRTSERDKLRDIVRRGHGKFEEFPTSLARTTATSVVWNCTLGEARDFNRHRAWGRFIPGFQQLLGVGTDHATAGEFIERGYGLPLYLTEIPEMVDEQGAFEDRLRGYYDHLRGFVAEVHRRFEDDVDYGFVLNLLPLAHQVDLHMHGDPAQANYFADLRVKPGGHVNYRALAAQTLGVIGEVDFFAGSSETSVHVDPASREQFFDRS